MGLLAGCAVPIDDVAAPAVLVPPPDGWTVTTRAAGDEPDEPEEAGYAGEGPAARITLTRDDVPADQLGMTCEDAAQWLTAIATSLGNPDLAADPGPGWRSLADQVQDCSRATPTPTAPTLQSMGFPAWQRDGRQVTVLLEVTTDTTVRVSAMAVVR